MLTAVRKTIKHYICFSIQFSVNLTPKEMIGATEKLFKAIMNTNTETIPGYLIVYALEYTM